MLRQLFILFCLFPTMAFLTPGHAMALQEGNSFDLTIKELRNDLNKRTKALNSQKDEIETFISDYSTRRETTDKALKEISVVLYSLNQDNMFTLAFFSKQIAELKSTYNKKKFPAKKILRLIDNEIAQLSNLSKSISEIKDEELTEEGKTAKGDALSNCESFERRMVELRGVVSTNEEDTIALAQKIDSLDVYAKNQMDEMMKRMFIEPAISYHGISRAWQAFSHSLKSAYFSPSEQTTRTKDYHTVWQNIILFLISSYVILYGAFYIAQKRNSSRGSFLTKKFFYYWGAAITLLAAILFFSRFFQSQAIINSTINIASQFMVLSALVILSLTVRIKAEQLTAGIKFYLPSIHLCLFFIFLRICMAPNVAVNFLTPIVFTLISIFQIVVHIKYRSKLERIDRGFGTTALILFLISTIFSWNGYSYMAIIVNLIWIMFVFSILIMLALWNLLHRYQEKRASRKENANRLLSPFISKLFFPLLGALMVVFSCMWPASIFDVTHIIRAWSTQTLAIPQIISHISISGITTIIIIGIILNYIIFITGSIIRDIYQDSYETAAAATYVTLGTLFVWALFSIISLACLGVNFNGILVIMGGMSMGIGFALKDTIDNLISGLSLVFGRLKQGDVIECDGIRGKVSSIGFRTTFIETLDGSIIGFLNSQLFNKNFRNLTKNHLYESVKIEIGIAYGTDIEEVRKIILDAVRQVDTLPRSRTSSVVLDSFGDNAVHLAVWVWVPVRNKPATLSRVRECIYQAFNENGISIPFPQQDLYIKETPNKVVPAEEK